MKQKLMLLAILLTVSFESSFAQTDSVAPKKKWPSFLSADLLPDGTNYLPAPPAFSCNTFAGDIAWYNIGKSLRNTARGEQAKRDADIMLKGVLEAFSEAFGMELSEAKTPEVASFVGKVITDACSSTRKAKKHYKRMRPFLYFNEGTLVPEEEASHHTPSYPSSHSATGWAVALVLSELNPDRAEQILARGYEYGQSRVIAGYHYQSDVEAARLAASACVARLHADEAFQKELKRAKKELKKAWEERAEKLDNYD